MTPSTERFTSVAYDADRAAERVARAGHVDDARADQPAGERLRDAERPPAAAQPLEHRVLHRLVVDAEHEVAEDRAQLLLLGVDQRARLGLGRRLRGDAHDEPFDAAREERDRRVAACASSASSRCATISASADSDVPHVFSERDTIAAASPERRSRSGMHVLA